jgi:ribosomal protein S18 acetylase RimI-like enzyme
MIQLRNHVCPNDAEVVGALTAATGFFSEEEVEIARSLVDEVLATGAASGYEFTFAERVEGESTRCVGYACFGSIPATVSSYDVYWIVVDPLTQRQGVGLQLLAEVERRVTESGGERIYIDTASREQYLPTHRFYERAGYERAALLEDFFAPGDGKVIFCKRLVSRG